MKPSEKPINRVDQFFKNKLDDHSIAPAENAWAKVEVGLSKKNNIVLWRWAAAVLLMGALISVVYWSQKGFEKSQPVLAHQKNETNRSNPVLSSDAKASTPKATPLVKEKANHIVNTNSNQHVESSSEIIATENHKTETIAQVEIKEQPIVKVVNESVAEEKIKTQATTKTEVASTQQKPIKLEFTLEDLPSAETVATTNEVKNSGLKKVLELAREMKQGEGPLSNLREKKNELFAHNFITGKERAQ